MPRARRWAFVVLYSVSGAAALVYEVTWTRLFTLYLGHTVAAASTVLAAFMGGLAAGAWLTRNTEGRLRTYALLELLAAAIAIALPLAVGATTPALTWAYADGSAPARFAFVRITISLALLGVPAAAMGATFPVASRWFSPEGAAGAGPLYAANTAGAAVGALAGGFWLVPALGGRGTTWVGVALNVIAALGALWLARGHPVATAPAPPTSAPRARRRMAAPDRPASAAAPQPLIAWIAVAVSGFVALVFEVAWTRLLALAIGPTTYAFATMAASFITGLAIGSATASAVVKRIAQPAALLAGTLAGTAVAALLAAWYAASRLPLVVAGQVADPAAAFTHVIATQGAIVALLLLPMTFMLGAAFPLALAAASRGAARVGRDVAAVYAANTGGAIAGALAGGFILLPSFGLEATFRVTSLVAGLVGLTCWVLASRAAGASLRRAVAGGVAGAVAVTLAIALPQWDRDLLASGAYKYAPYVKSGDLDAALRAGHLEFYEDGAAATVTVRDLAGVRSLAIDGKVDASNGADMLTQRLLGLLPMLLHRQPRDICVIGLGSGVTVESALAAGGVRRADVVEISREVVDASALFRRENGHVLDRPAVRLILGDGRSHLQLTRSTYDVIISEPSNPWMAGVAALFTREFFESARERLAPDGLLCQWAHTYDISGPDLRSIVRTFASVFPDGTMWLVGEGDLLLVGSRGQSVESRLPLVAARWQRGSIPALLQDVGVAGGATPFALLSLFAGGPAELQAFAGTAPIQTDDRMALEFSAPRGIYGRLASENTRDIRALADSRPATITDVLDRATAGDWTVRGRMELKAEAYELAFEAFERAVRLDPTDREALAGLTEAAAGGGREPSEAALLDELAAAHPGSAAVRIEQSRLLAAQGDYPAARAAAQGAMAIAPDDPHAGEQFASVLADAGDRETLAPFADRLAARFPDRVAPRYFQAAAAFLAGNPAAAADRARAIVVAHPQDARSQNLLGIACASLGHADCARTAFLAALDANPRDPTTYVNLGQLRIQTGDAAGAIESFSAALALDPSSTAARDGLAQARAARTKS
jgi:spermidine synthase